MPVADEARGARVADEERRDDECSSSTRSSEEKLGVHDAAALDHELPDAAIAEVLARAAASARAGRRRRSSPPGRAGRARPARGPVEV